MVSSRKHLSEVLSKFEKEYNIIKETVDDKIGSFWVVTEPLSLQSTLEDIFFKTDIDSLLLQVKGGLNEDDIVLATHDEDEARAKAIEIINKLKTGEVFPREPKSKYNLKFDENYQLNEFEDTSTDIYPKRVDNVSEELFDNKNYIPHVFRFNDIEGDYYDEYNDLLGELYALYGSPKTILKKYYDDEWIVWMYNDDLIAIWNKKELRGLL